MEEFSETDFRYMTSHPHPPKKKRRKKKIERAELEAVRALLLASHFPFPHDFTHLDRLGFH